MKRLILLTVATLAVVFAPHHASARTYLDDNAQPVMVGSCTLVSTPSEADATHVYTLNPDFTSKIGLEYYHYWGRLARCDELQFHINHNTSLNKLDAWLKSVEVNVFKNISSSSLRGQTVSTSRHEWFFVDKTGIHRIPDWLTAMSWGLLVEDRISIGDAVTTEFYTYAKLAAPVNFTNGRFADTMHAIWKEGLRDFSSLPTRLQNEVSTYTYGYHKIFTSCPDSCGSGSDHWCGELLDWRWYQSNPGYRTCPSGGAEFDWREGNSEQF